MNWLQIVSGLCLTVLILFACYVFTRYIGRGMQIRGRGMTGRLKLIDRMALAPDKSIVIVQVGERYLLLGISSGQVNLLMEIPKEEMGSLKPDGNPDGQNGAFSVLLRQMLEKTKEKKG